MGAVRVTGRFFTLEDPEKLLYHWASIRDFNKDIIFKGYIDLPILEIEGRIPPEAIFACFSAARMILKSVPADYDKVFIYAKNKQEILKRYKIKKGRENLIILKADKFLNNYGGKTTLAQTFVDLWNQPQWFAREYTKALKERINDLLS